MQLARSLYTLVYTLMVTKITASDNTIAADAFTQVVPYNPAEFIKPFHEKARKFVLCDREWTLVQDWEQDGVAGVVWETAIVLVNFLVNNPSIVKGKRVIELGAGTGLVGMATATLGARCVDITDRNIRLTKQNLERNLGDHHCASVIHYEWGQPIQAPLTLPYDLILGSDVIYIEDTYHLLLQSLEQLCAASKDTVILLASKLRYNKVQNFLKLLETKFKFHVINKSDANNIYIYWITLKV